MEKLESPKNGDSGFKKFAELYPKYVAGAKWLDERKAQGHDVAKDTEDYCVNVLAPLDKLYQAFNAEERKAADRLMAVYEKFDGKSIKVKEKAA